MPLHVRRSQLWIRRDPPPPPARSKLVDRIPGLRDIHMEIIPNPFYLEAEMRGGRLEYDVPITPIE